MASSRLQALWNHPAGPKTKNQTWISREICSINDTIETPILEPGSVTNVQEESVLAEPDLDFQKPPENISYLQQTAVTCTGMIWCRCSTVIIPKNWNLFSVNVAMAATGIYQLTRKIKHDYVSEAEAAVENE